MWYWESVGCQADIVVGYVKVVFEWFEQLYYIYLFIVYVSVNTGIEHINFNNNTYKLYMVD